jgi:hypothetical protein
MDKEGERSKAEFEILGETRHTLPPTRQAAQSTPTVAAATTQSRCVTAAGGGDASG